MESRTKIKMLQSLHIALLGKKSSLEHLYYEKYWLNVPNKQNFWFEVRFMIRKRASSHVTRADGTKELLLLASVKIY